MEVAVIDAMPELMDVTHFPSATGAVRNWAVSRPDEDAVVFVRNAETGDAEHVSYAELDLRARRIASWLQEHCPAGSRVLLLYPPVEFITAFLGCVYAGMIAVPAPLPGSYQHERRRLHGIAADAAVAAVLTDTACHAEVADWAAGEGQAGLTVLATDTADFADPDAWTEPELTHESVALLQYTSGSTGEPKGVMVSHGNLLVNASSLFEALGVEEGTRFGGWAPLFHDMGLMAQTLPALFAGSTAVLMSPVSFLKRPYQWLRMIDRYDIGWSAAPNFAYELCTRRVTDDQIAGLDLSRWRFAVNGSEPVRASTMAEFAKRFAAAGLSPQAPSPCYGLAESTVFVSGAGHRLPFAVSVDTDLLERHEFKTAAHHGSVRELLGNGRAPRYEIEVVEPETRTPLPAGRVGEVWLRGPNVAQGYWGRPEATEATFRAVTSDGDPGWLRTGDLGTLHEGDLFITGRLKETLIIRGRNLYPQDVEHELRSQHPGLGNVGAVFTVPVQGAAGEEEGLVVTHEVQVGLGAAELSALAAGIKQTVLLEFGTRIAAVRLLRRGHVRRTTSGKIQRAAMRELFLAGDLAAEYAEGLVIA